VEVIDKVGGIEYDVDVTVRNESGRVLLNKGPQLLDGEKFLHYVRYRGVAGIPPRQPAAEDLIAAFSQLKEKGKLKDLPQIYKSLTENVETNLTLTQITALAVFGLKVIPKILTPTSSPERISSHPGAIRIFPIWSSTSGPESS